MVRAAQGMHHVAAAPSFIWQLWKDSGCFFSSSVEKQSMTWIFLDGAPRLTQQRLTEVGPCVLCNLQPACTLR